MVTVVHGLVGWIALSAVFLFLTYLFRDKITVEGFIGYAVLLAVIVPANLFGHPLLGLVGLHDPPPPVFFAALAVADLVLLTSVCYLLPGLTVSNWFLFVVFVVLFAAAASAWHYVPIIQISL